MSSGSHSPSSSRFETTPRPPTPPKDVSTAVDDAISFLDDCNEIDRALNKAHASTAEQTALLEANLSSSQDSVTASNGLKKVDFSPDLVYHRAPRQGQLTSPHAQLLKRTPSSRDSRPLRSILKLSNPPPPLTPEDIDSKLSYFSPDVPGSFAKMIQSAIHQLASQSRHSRLDAYLALNGTLRAYESVPDAPAMVQKINLFQQFLTRDMAWKQTDGTIDTQIVTQAIKLAVSMLFDSKLSEAFDDDFRTFLVDRSITVMEQPEMPKAIVKMHMYLLAQQRFSTTIVTAVKADRVVTALQTIEDRCSSNSVVATRLMIYERLLDQARTVMLTRIRDWLESMFHGMLSSITEIRTRAIETCTRAGLTLGTQPNASKALTDLLESGVDESQSYCDYLAYRLVQMISDKETGPSVPQIWTTVIYFFRNKRRPLERWSQFKSWLMIVQKCFNSSDLSIRHQASLAWNRLVFAIMPDASTSKAMMSMLMVPIHSSLEKRGADSHSKQIRNFALDSYYNLLFYAFRPGLSVEEYDRAWESFVQNTLCDMSKGSSKARLTALCVLQGLLRPSDGVWNINAALSSTAVKPEELPRLDPKWARTRLARLLKVLEPAISINLCSGKDTLDLYHAWRALLQSLVDAGTQEVRISNDLKEAIALLVNVFRRLWCNRNQPPAGANDLNWLHSYVALVDETIQLIGPSPFAEDILSVTKENGVEVAPTPSHRHSKQHVAPRSPLAILLGQFRYPPNDLVPGEEYSYYASMLLERLTSAKTSPVPRFHLLNGVFQTWFGPQASPMLADVAFRLWISIADNATSILVSLSSSINGQDSPSVSDILRIACEILSTDPLHLPEFLSEETRINATHGLYDAMFDVAKAKAGDVGVVSAVMEPLALSMLDHDGQGITLRNRLNLGSHLLRHSLWPKTRQSTEQARRVLLGGGGTLYKGSAPHSFDHVYNMIVKLMTDVYHGYVRDGSETGDDIELHNVETLKSSIFAFLDRSPLDQLATALCKTQGGFAIWMSDPSGHGRRQEALGKTPNTSEIWILRDDEQEATELVLSIWSTLIRYFEKLPAKDSALLKGLETLLIAGFSSPHREVVNKTIIFWNETFGVQPALDYPEGLERVLRARSADADISLPSFPEEDGSNSPASLPPFYESRDQRPHFEPHGEPSPQNLALSCGQPNHGNTERLLLRSAAGTAQDPHPARDVSRRSASVTPNARLRHDNSQIQFTAIESSPLVPAEESQHLTEHQQEVSARQHADTSLFPGLSSSPMAQSTALPRPIQKRLDFSSGDVDAGNDHRPGTPTGLQDPIVPSSDDLPPSSPTPSSTRDGGQAVAVEVDSDHDAYDAVEDLPSSPPRVSEAAEVDRVKADQEEEEVDPDETIVVETIIAITEPEEVEEAQRLPELQHRLKDDGNEKEPIAEQEEQSQSEADEQEQLPEPTVESTEDPDTDRPGAQLDLDFPSDSLLPTVQLQMEEEAAAIASQSLHQTTQAAPTDVEATDEHIEKEGSLTPRPKDTTAREESVAQSPQSDHSNTDEVPDGAITRVENSFIEPAAPPAGTDAQSTVSSPPSQRNSKKRKRPSSVVYTSKKRKPQSPFKRLFSGFWGQSQEDDDDMEEEIVVASSQPLHSQSNVNTQEESRSPSESADVPPQPLVASSQPLQSNNAADTEQREDPSSAVAAQISQESSAEPVRAVKQEQEQEQESVMEPPPKRGRGRPRKSQTPNPSQEVIPNTSLKRRASTLSVASTSSETRLSTSFVKDTPAPVKARKLRSSQDVSSAEIDSSSREVAETRKATRREVTGVLVEKTSASSLAEDPAQERPNDEMVGTHDRETSDKPADAEEVHAPMAGISKVPDTARSVLGHLRGLLSDLKGMMFGSQEEREFDDVLFEIKKEVFEAGRRGRGAE